MKTAVISSNNVSIFDIASYLPADITLMLTITSEGIDALAQNYACEQGIESRILFPDKNYDKKISLATTKKLVSLADRLIAFWDGKSKDIISTFNYARAIGKIVNVFII